MDWLLGVDCGATHLRVGLVSHEGKLLAAKKVASPLKTNSGQFGQILIELAEQLWQQQKKSAKLLGVGIGVPGPLDPQKGLILPASNLHNQQPLQLLMQLRSLTTSLINAETPILFDRDTNIALLGEIWQGAARGNQNVVMLTVGTGVGGAMQISGQLFRGQHYRAGEIGHMIISSFSKVKCGLGHQGCLEGLVQQAADEEELSLWLGLGVTNIVQIFDPQMIIFGGGQAAYKRFLPQVIKVARNHCPESLLDKIRICYAEQGELSGVYGAAKLVLENFQ
ncbi:MAG: ROK family protein [Patescibacteria group bacterium]|nr:ROK family protein [Patescibacteria group bacterium]